MALREALRAERGQYGIAMAMVDIDHFKRVNDSFGHPVGDQVIMELAALLRACTRRDDVIAPWGAKNSPS